MKINKLDDLNRFRSSPVLTDDEIKKLSGELESKILHADWITVGIMASNDYEAINTLNSITSKYSLTNLEVLNPGKTIGRVFLKGNQKTGHVYIRSENGLGEGILLTCQYEGESSASATYGPFPLNFFSN